MLRARKLLFVVLCFTNLTSDDVATDEAPPTIMYEYDSYGDLILPTIPMLNGDADDRLKLFQNIDKSVSGVSIDSGLTLVHIIGVQNIRKEHRIYLYSSPKHSKTKNNAVIGDNIESKSMMMYICINCVFAEWVQNKLIEFVEQLPNMYKTLNVDDDLCILDSDELKLHIDLIEQKTRNLISILFNFITVHSYNTFNSLVDMSLLRTLVSTNILINYISKENKISKAVIVNKFLKIVNKFQKYLVFNCDVKYSYYNKYFFGYSMTNQKTDKDHIDIDEFLDELWEFGLKPKFEDYGVQQMLLGNVLTSNNDIVKKELNNLDLKIMKEYSINIDEKLFKSIENSNDLDAEITVYDFNEKSQIPGPDPVKWNLNLDSINFLLANPPKIDISTIPFAETKRMFGNISRRLTPDHFMRKLQNGEKKLREWILYSPSKNALFCFQCLLFLPKPTVFGNKNEGFINWKKCNESLQEHEASKTHAESVRIWFSRIKKEDRGVIDLELKLNIENQISYWKNVLYRVVETVSFLASRGLAFRGNSHNFGSKQNGNYLGCLELVAKFDPFLSAHIANYGNKGKGNVSYLSSNICDEFISLMSDTVIDKIVSEIKERKYFSLIVDSTPDVTTRDQLTVAIRYISNEGLPVERFLGFIPSVGHKGSDMEQALLKKFCELNIDLKFCRGQSYDNASNMSGVYNGLQTRIKNYSSTAFFVPCSAHSLNLIGSNAADTTQEGTKFFFICQAIYNFFSVSTFRWNILTNIIEKNPGCVKIKKLCSTRWSSRYDVCRAMCNGYAQVLSALNTICDDEGQKKDTRHEARSIKNKIESLNFCFMICMWTPILQRFNATSISLQSIDIDLATVVTLYDSLEKYVEDFRERFDVYLEQAKTMCSKQLFSWDGVRQKKRNKFFDETESNEELLGGEQKMKCEVFYVIIDKLAMNLRERKLSYTDINNNFGFILKLDTLDINGIRESAKNLVKIYPEDLNETFIEELVQFKNILNLFSKEDKSSFISLLKCLTNSSLLTTFPNVEIVLRIFCCMASSNASGERSFSVLKRIKNYLRSALVDEKMSSLSILNIESDILQQIDWSDIIHKFAVLKSRKKLI
ncbi:hypothetical protein QTP88_003794 [Uroleucon formosanum]